MKLPNLDNEKEIRIFILQTAGIFIIVFTVFVVMAAILGLIPNDLTTNDSSTRNLENSRQNGLHPEVETGDEYVRGRIFENSQRDRERQDGIENGDLVAVTIPGYISIPTIGLDWKIEDPESAHIDTLNDALDRGPVYYPGSGYVEQGNIFVFGHSSYLPIVNNKAYKAFNDIQKLKVGDEIEISASGGVKYIYSVEKVELVDADEELIDLSKPGRRLTLSTCNVFGQKSDRWVVDAVFKEVKS